MDRKIIYTGQIPLDTDLLGATKDAYMGLSKLAAALFGTGATFANGLACSPNSPADLTVIVAPGEIYSLENVDDAAYSSIALDTTHQILKQGVVLDDTELSCPAPGTAGFSINYLVQAEFSEADDTAVALPYYNAADPTSAWVGPSNSGATQNTRRANKCVVTVKAGSAATTGTQTTPTPDAGKVGLWVVTVDNAQTEILAADIAQYIGAPFIPQAGAASNAHNAMLTKSVAGSSNVTLDAAEAAYPIIKLTGALTGNINLVVPASSRRWVIQNATSGSYAITVKTASGTGVVVKQSATSMVHCDGTNVDFTGKAGGTPSQFDNSALLATTEFVKQAQGNTSGVSSANADTTLTLAQLGNLFAFYGSTASQTITLPDAATVPAGYGYDIINQASVPVTLAGHSSQNINANTYTGASAANTLVLNPGDSVYVTSNGVSVWNSFGISSRNQFPSSLATGGYQKLPSGLIVQWGNVTSSGTSAGNATATLPIAFPTSCLQAYASIANTGAAASITVQVGSYTTTSVPMSALNNGAYVNGQTVRYLAIGY